MPSLFKLASTCCYALHAIQELVPLYVSLGILCLLNPVFFNEYPVSYSSQVFWKSSLTSRLFYFPVQNYKILKIQSSKLICLTYCSYILFVVFISYKSSSAVGNACMYTLFAIFISYKSSSAVSSACKYNFMFF